MGRACTEDFLKGFDDSAYPDSFLETYEVMECLAENLNVDTFLVRHRQAGELRIAKCCGDTALTSEVNLLKTLRHDALPRFIEEHINENMRCSVYEYIQGIQLGSLCDERPLDEKSIISIMTQLCDVLIYLHGQAQPIIHRDIKPQNIIVEDSGKVRLIDFGISRVYDESALKDTVYAGTLNFAPPEQFGFSQTDCRSDIYSMGVLLRWLLTGSTDGHNVNMRIKNPRLEAIVGKCTAFSPKDRYPNVQKLRRELSAAEGRNPKKPYRRLVVSVISLLLAASAGFCFGRYTDIGKAAKLSRADTVEFSEPEIERAVRLALGKAEDEPLNIQDLESVTNLYVFGSEPAENEETYNALGEHFSVNDGTVRRGKITRLNDIAMLPNIRVLGLAYQNIEDLSPLTDCHNLERIDLRHNPVSDVSPLGGLKLLEALTVFDTNVSDLNALKDCPSLTVLDAGSTLVESPAAFDGLIRLRELALRDAPVKTLEQIGGHTYLEKLYISHTDILDLAALLELPRLRLVEVSSDMIAAADAVINEARFEIRYAD